jgi:aminoglycoside phosphotransferase (APT) family kinase protein
LSASLPEPVLPFGSLPEPVLRFLRESRLVGVNEMPPATPLPGGVSSDIWRVDLARGPVCVKRALPRLRVAQVWEAPVERNRYEYEWFRVAGEAAPQAVPRVIAQREGVFAMEYLAPARHPVWKTLLAEGRADPAFAAQVGRALAAIHAATAGRDEIARRFPTDEIFYKIRLEPYLVFTGSRFPELQKNLNAIVERTANTKLCLVHGDVSPKNILCGPDGPVFLDAECAWYGDPAFDVAFCLNHLLLKCLWIPAAAGDFLLSFQSLFDAYRSKLSWEKAEALESRTATLLPALLLARVDGKSPVEYLVSEKDRQHVRTTARELLLQPAGSATSMSVASIREAWQKSLK